MTLARHVTHVARHKLTTVLVIVLRIENTLLLRMNKTPSLCQDQYQLMYKTINYKDPMMSL